MEGVQNSVFDAPKAIHRLGADESQKALGRLYTRLVDTYHWNLWMAGATVFQRVAIHLSSMHGISFQDHRVLFHEKLRCLKLGS